MRLYLRNFFYRYMTETTLSLFVLGSALKTAVDICDINPVRDANGNYDVAINNLKIVHLKSRIWNNIKENDDNINKAIHLKLWKVEIPRDDKLLDELDEMFRKGKDVENQLGKALEQDDSYKEWFPSDYQLPDKTVHIIVQPPPPATTGKCLPMVYLSNKKFIVKKIIEIDLMLFFFSR